MDARFVADSEHITLESVFFLSLLGYSNRMNMCLLGSLSRWQTFKSAPVFGPFFFFFNFVPINETMASCTYSLRERGRFPGNATQCPTIPAGNVIIICVCVSSNPTRRFPVQKVDTKAGMSFVVDDSKPPSRPRCLRYNLGFN